MSDSFYTVVERDSLIYHFERKSSCGSKVALFDFDHTIARPKGGKTFPKGADDYEYLDGGVRGVLQNLREEGYTIYIVTNQGSLMTPRKRGALVDFLKKIRQVYDEIGPFSICIACGDTWYRKPHRGAIALYEEKCGVRIHRGHSFYCGDALGRPGDFAASDLYFAVNNGLKIYSPEGFFVGEGRRATFDYTLPERPYLDALFDKERGRAFLEALEAMGRGEERRQTMIVLTGSPASGKSTLADFLEKRYGYKRIASDEYSTKTAMKRAVEEAWEMDESLVIDATHPSRESRKVWVDLARRRGGGIIISIYIPYQEELLYHMLHYRIEVNHLSELPVPLVAQRVFKSRFERPTKAEGFDEVIAYQPFLEIAKKHEENIFRLYY